MENFEIAGLWHVPGETDVEVGILSFDRADGFRVQVPFGAIGAVAEAVTLSGNSTRTPIMHGTLRDGRRATLVDAVITGSSTSFPGGRTETHSALLGFVGRVETSANPVVEEVTLGYSNLRDWVGIAPIKAIRPTLEKGPAGQIEYHYDPVPASTIASGEGWSIDLCHVSSQSSVSVKGFHLDHDCVLALKLEQPWPLDKLEGEILRPLWQFLSFALNRNVDVRETRIRLAGSVDWLEVCRAQILAKPEESVLEPYMLLPMRVLGDRIASVLDSWLSLSGDMRRAISLMLGLDMECRVPTDLAFLAAAQALEAMARVDECEFGLEPSEFERRRELVRDSVPDKVVAGWAFDKLQFRNYRSAGSMLRGLLKSLGEYPSLVAPDLERFLVDHRESRNFYTHRSEAGVPRALQPQELFVHTQGVVLLLKAATLRRLGFTEPEVTSLLNECQGTLQWRFTVAEQYANTRPE